MALDSGYYLSVSLPKLGRMDPILGDQMFLFRAKMLTIKRLNTTDKDIFHIKQMK